MEKRLRCALCGKVIEGKPSKDHCHPRAIYKWLENTLDPAEFQMLYDLISSKANLIFTHDGCNKEKEDFAVDVTALYLPYYKKKAVMQLHQRLKPYAQQYREMKDRIYDRQSHCCYHCGCALSQTNGVMRRIDLYQPRVEENGCLVCHSCNQTYINFSPLEKAADANLPTAEQGNEETI